MANQVIGEKVKPKPAATKTYKKDEPLGQSYWAKGTGFGTGSTSTQWDLEQVCCCIRSCMLYHELYVVLGGTDTVVIVKQTCSLYSVGCSFLLYRPYADFSRCSI